MAAVNDVPTFDAKKAEAFAGRVMAETTGVLTTAMSRVGDELGLWKDLRTRGPATSADLSKRLGFSERHVREWLSAMAAAGYLEYCRDTKTFCLPPEHGAVLAEEGGPAFFGGAHEILFNQLTALDRIIETFKTGGGVPQGAYPDGTYDGMERFSASWYENLLLPVWIPSVPGLQQKLERGITVADVGCGRGRALIKLAERFPKSLFTGFDVYGPNIQKARENAERAGVASRVTFEQRDVSESLPGAFDLILTVDVVHDAVDPQGLLTSIRRALGRDGVYLCLDMNCSHELTENLHPLGAFMYSISVLYCMSTSLAHGGAALGTCGVPPKKLEEMASAAGFKRFRKVPIENPFNNLYELNAGS